MQTSKSLTLLLSLGISPFCLCVLPNPSGLASISFYYILLLSLRNGFLMRDIKRMDPDGRGEEGKLGRGEGGETNQDIFCEKRVYFQ